MGEAPGRFSKRPDHVKTPYREGPSDRDGLEGLRREMCLSSKKLASFAAPHDLVSICHGSRPVEALSEGFPDQSARGCVVPAFSSVDVLQEPPALNDRDASLEDS